METKRNTENLADIADEIMRKCDWANIFGKNADTEHSFKMGFVEGTIYMKAKTIEESCRVLLEQLSFPTEDEDDKKRNREIVEEFRKSLEGEGK